MKTEDSELEDGPILLCQCCAHAMWLLAVGYFHVPCDPVPGPWAGQMGQQSRTPDEVENKSAQHLTLYQSPCSHFQMPKDESHLLRDSVIEILMYEGMSITSAVSICRT